MFEPDARFRAGLYQRFHHGGGGADGSHSIADATAVTGATEQRVARRTRQVPIDCLNQYSLTLPKERLVASLEAAVASKAIRYQACVPVHPYWDAGRPLA